MPAALTLARLQTSAPDTRQHRGTAGAVRTGFTLMPDEVRALHEMAAQVNTMRELLARIDTKLDTAVAGHVDHETRLRVQEDVVPKDLRTQLAEIRQELEDLKKVKWLLAGAAAAVGGVTGRLAGFL